MTNAVARLTTALADRYRLERELGSGGMATVYLAHDLKHDRKVAIKVLRPELGVVLGAERFLREIKIAAQLNHPNILGMHDSGSVDGLLYYVMPFIAGESLRGKLVRERHLTIDDAVRITSQVASALDFAHRQHVIHRDIKPENVLLHEGQAVVADFGIALAVTNAGGDRLTETGLSLGTPQYMSPEQATGDRQADGRTDVYALGAVLYELLTGDPPFTASSTQGVIAKLMTDRPTAPRAIRDTVPAHVEDAVLKALAKLPADRFPTAAAFATALETPDTATARSANPSLVVVPFINRSPDAENEYFSDGLTEEIIADLSKLDSLRIISRNSAMQLKGTTKDSRTLGRELGVEHVLSGTVRRAGAALRITVELVTCETDTPVWGEKYSGAMEDVFDLQERISRQIVEALQVVVSPEESARLAARPIANVQAYECYMLARKEANRFTLDGLNRAEQLLERALGLTGDNALLFAYQAWVRAGRSHLSPDPDPELWHTAETIVARALELDPACAMAHVVTGWMGCFVPDKAATMHRNLHRALELEPNNPDALLWLADYYAETGRAERAIDYARRAREVDPLSWLAHAKLVAAHFWSGQKEDAYREAEAMMVTNRDEVMVGWVHSYFNLARQRRLDELAQFLERWHAGLPENFYLQHISLLNCALRGDREGALALVTPGLEAWAATNMQAPVFMAEAYALIGEVDKAVDWLGTSFAWGCTNYPYFAEYNDFLEPVRHDARGLELLERVKVAWQEQQP